MLILSLDTTTRAGGAGVLRDDVVLAVAEGDGTRTHGERLPAEIASVLRIAGIELSQIDLLAVARGPGAFTGLRIGLAAMQGLAMVTGRPVVGVSALDALAAAGFEVLGVDRARLCAWMDAARGEVFAAAYDASGRPGDVPMLTALTEPEVDSPDAILDRWRGAGVLPVTSHAVFIGDGADHYGELLTSTRRLAAPLLAPAIARLGWRRAAGGAHPPHALQPLYVRRPDAERSLRR